MKNRILFAAGLCMQFGMLAAQFDSAKNKQIAILDNGTVNRSIQFLNDQTGITSVSMKLNNSKEEFLSKGSDEFYFEIDGKPCSGSSNWHLVSVEKITGENQGTGTLITMKIPEQNITIGITYLMYPNLPIIRKKISLINTGVREVNLESVEVERINFSGSATGVNCWVMGNYARQKNLQQFIGDWYDPVVLVHELNLHRGIILGNEAPGVTKRTTAFLKPGMLTIGLTRPEQTYPFRKWLKPGEEWESPWVFTGLYSGTDDTNSILNGTVNDFVRKHLGTRLSVIPQKPTFVYNTWIPFRKDINEKMLFEIVDAAADCGIEEFVIDDGWQTNYGDWGIDPIKFPNGLKPVFDHIKSKGMKPGIWISIAVADEKSNVYNQHPKWLVRKANGMPMNFMFDEDAMYGTKSYSMCMTTQWYDHIKKIIIGLIKDYGLEYLKGDFAIATSPYTSDKTKSGCYAPDHTMHKDRNESMLQLYQRTWDLFDDLHEVAPNLFIDCTYETMGGLQLIDLDMCKHAEGNWLSNFHEAVPTGSLRVRQMSWWRTPVIPATALVIGNQRIDDPAFEISLMSLIGSLPIVLGDPRLLNPEQRGRIKSWSEWIRTSDNKHGIMMYRQDLPGYGEPIEGCWDGYQRINSDTRSGGIVGVFRQNSPETQRMVTIKYLDPAAKYEITKAPTGEKIHTATGKELAGKGFTVTLDKPIDGAIFEISRIE